LDVVATAPSVEYDFISRYFWPASGGDEDFVTGSIHTGLAPYWAAQLGKNSLSAYQASQRGGKLHCEVGDTTVTLTGHA
ncbi:PhzF family phenazine biosynthesis protein, partial [Psychrobacter sp. SIMBA_152]